MQTIWRRQSLVRHLGTMTRTATLYHNPSCSKSRSAHGILTDYNASREASEQVDVHVVEYLKTPPDAATIESLLSMLFPDEVPPNPVRLMRTGNKEFSELHLDELDPTVEDQRQQLIASMVAQPSLIERPIFVKDGRAVIGRPPDRVLELL
ncbi:Aste57867_5610 [Aphanomyces stellatus]|uniref:Aste57867_5610 protein n=1 Tax=Aphanomyces stellatus TaxID=120398 RepID=A0A485KHG7_9STRA|nr:hypothetical protein As57867_005597 [Aphanomyces stellatus]VFT82656.1 Aste57867_5610 [Aphanomyces stellatus]